MIRIVSQFDGRPQLARVRVEAIDVGFVVSVAEKTQEIGDEYRIDQPLARDVGHPDDR